MEFRVLGPIEVIEDGRRLVVASGRQLTLLTLLVINANRAVSADRIIDELWGDEPPESGAKTVAFHISRLRDTLEPGRPRGALDGIIATEPAGYVLRAAPDSIDAVRFEHLAAEGRALVAEDRSRASSTLGAALALWRGEPFADLSGELFVEPEARRLEELRRRTVEDRLDAELDLGHHQDAIGQLEALVTEDPLRDRARGQLMTALYRAGRQAEALRVYGEGRRLLADELGIDPSPELQQLEGWILRQDPRLELRSRPGSVRNPYKGLRPFGELDSGDFFGRELLVGRLVERLGQVARAGRFLAVVGPSGSGKSSVVRAGLVPALRGGALPDSDRWRIALMLPGTQPFRELAAALGAPGSRVPVSGTPDSGGRDSGLHDGLDDTLECPGGLARAIEGVAPEAPQVLLVIDQFEELFSQVEDEEDRARFVTALINALAVRDGRLLVVATLRADFFDRPLLSPGLGELMRTGTEIVTPLTRDELERSIARPAESVGVQLEPGLATEAIADLARQPGELPLLQYALTELFERNSGGRLTRDGYAAIGGVLGALGRRADEVYAGLDADGREIVRQAFLRLVSSDESGEPMARRVPRSELRATFDDPRRVDQALDAFDRGRLLSFDRDAVTGEPTVQVAHEALLTRWPRLTAWIEDAREDLRTRRRLSDAATEWIRAGRNVGFLLSGSRLDLLATWADSTDLRLDLPERELLDTSLAERHRLDKVDAERTKHERAVERRARNGLRALVAVLAVAALVATSLLVVVYGQGETAREQSAIATARELASGSIGNLGTDPRLSLLLAWQAADATADRGYVVEEAMNALQWALQATHVAFPAGQAPVAVRAGPGGARGVLLLAPGRLMTLAATAAGRGFSREECRTYLHRDACPPPPAPARTEPTLDVYTSSGIVPVERLATGSLVGSHVDVVSQLPGALAPVLADIGVGNGIDVRQAAGADADLEARVASGDLPDVAIVSRPALVAELARQGLLVEMSTFVDVATQRSTAGEYLTRLGTVDHDGSWPAASGGLYGAAFATEAESLIWYPKTAFQRAGYTVPRTWDELKKLTAKMVAGGQTPWCLGLEAGNASGASAAGFVEDLVLHTSGPDVYLRWASGSYHSAGNPVRGAFTEFADLARGSGNVLGGPASTLLTPAAIAAWPMFVDPPECWLHLGGGTDRLAWPAGGATTVAAFQFPAVDPAFSNEVRGRVFTVIVFHDRPEVRRLVGSLLGVGLAAPAATSLVAAGVWPVGPALRTTPADELARTERDLLEGALSAGTFQVDASDLMPTQVAAAFQKGMVRLMSVGPLGLGGVLDGIDASWPTSR